MPVVRRRTTIRRSYLSGVISILLIAAAGCRPNNGQKQAGGRTLFAKVDSAQSGITFANTLHPTEDLNIITYLYYYNGGGISAGDLDGDGLVDLFFTSNQGDNALYLNRGNLKFEEVTDRAGVRRASGWSTGSSFTDFDGDGDLDLYVCKVSGVAGLSGRNELYVNDGDGQFEERAAEFGLDFSGLSTQAAFFDADGDGDMDVYLLNHSTHSTAQQRDTSARSIRSAYAGDRLYLQNERGTFTDATEGSGLLSSRLGYGLGLAVADFGSDGRTGVGVVPDPNAALPDIFVSNDFSEEDYLYQNLGGGRFRKTDWLPSSSMFSMGSAAADLDADGTLDLLTLDMRPYSDSIRKSSAGGDDLPGMKGKLRGGFGLQFAKNAALLNRGGQFLDAAVQLGIHSTDWSWAPAVLDADLDGQPDIVIGNGIIGRPNDLDYLKYSSGDAVQRKASNLELAGLMPSGLMPNRAFRGVRDAPFEEVSQAWGLAEVGSTTALIAVDLDNDGDEDIVTNNLNASAAIYENRSVGEGGFDRHPGVAIAVRDPNGALVIGTIVSVRQGEWRRAFAVQPVTGFQSSVIAPVVVGLPQPTDTFSLELHYPDGRSESRSGLLGSQVVLAKADPDSAWQATTAPRLASYPKSRAELYEAFDADPLTPIYPFPRPLDLDVGSINEKLGLSRLQEIELWSKMDSSLINSFQILSDGTALLAGLWSPVIRVSVPADKSRKMVIDTVAPAGLWLKVYEVSGRSGKYVLANVGLNTLLSESRHQSIELHVADFDRNGEVDPILVRVDSSGRSTLLGLDALAGQMPSMRRFFSSYLPFSASRFDRLFPPAEQIGGHVYRAAELRSYVYDAKLGKAVPMSFALQIGTPGTVRYLASEDSYDVEFITPPMRPELMSNNLGRLRVQSLR